MRQGVYDENILCADCDGFIGKFDQYAIELLKNGELKPYFNTSIFFYNDVKYEKLKLFFMSLLFRIHLCSKPFFLNFRLTEFIVNDLRKKICEENAGNKNEYFFVLTRVPNTIHDELFMSPGKKMIGGFRFAQVSLPYRFWVYIKIDGRSSLPHPLNKLYVEDPRLFVFDKGHKFAEEVHSLARKRCLEV